MSSSKQTIEKTAINDNPEIPKKAGTIKTRAAITASGNKAGPLNVKLRAINKRPGVISKEQWELPAGLTADGNFASLGQILSDHIPAITLESLSAEERKAIIAERIKRQNNYPAKYMLGYGVINKERAITEVLEGSPAGKFIMESEQNVIQLMKMLAKPESQGWHL